MNQMVIKAPQDIHVASPLFPKVFLSGSIEMGKAEDWQTKLAGLLQGVELVLLNPRRDDWDDTWVQSIDHPQFREQVEWELKAMDAADLIVYYFAPGTNAPITLLELGLHAEDNIIVCCPKGFYRKGNVDVTCAYYGIIAVDNLELLAEAIKESL